MERERPQLVDVPENGLSIQTSSIPSGGKGLFSVLDLPLLTVVSEYRGNKINPKDLIAYQSEPCFHDKLSYVATDLDGNTLIDPTDSNGQLLEEYKTCPAIYINEPPPGKMFNCAFCYNMIKRQLQVVTIVEIKAGDELFLFYGSSYPRRYLISEMCWAIDGISIFVTDDDFVLSIDGLPVDYDYSQSKTLYSCVLDKLNSKDIQGNEEF